MTNNLRPEDIGQSDPRLANAASKLSKDVPAAYIPIELSTKGMLGAPKKFHAKNFSTENLLNLSLADDDELPRRVCEMLDDLIFEDDITVKDFHEQEVIEFLIIIYKTFFTTVLRELEFPFEEDDRKFLMEKHGGMDSDEFRGRIRSIENKTWNPKFEIDLEKLTMYDITPDFKSSVKLTKKNGFTCTYSFPRYGDVVVLKDFLNIIYKEKDKQFATLTNTIKFNNDAKDRFLKGEEVNIASLPIVPKAEEKKIREYETEKSLFVMTAVRALHLVEFKGTDVSKWPLDKKMEIAKDPELDYNSFIKVSEYFGKLEVGIKKEIEVVNPFQDNKVMTRRYSFRLFDIFQALQRGDSDGIALDFV